MKGTLLQLRLTSPFTGADETRRFTRDFLERSGADAARAAELSMVVHELLDNALSYSPGPGSEVRFSLGVASGEALIHVSNRTSEEHIRRLERVSPARGERDSKRHFQKMLSVRSEPGRSGLGLARAWYEGRVEVAVTVKGSRITVRARGPLHVTPPTRHRPSDGDAR